MFNWIREYLELKYEFKERSSKCESCETLKMQLEIANHEKSQLLTRLLEKPESEVRPVQTEEIKPIMPKTVPWNVRRQMIEAEDREKAKLMRIAPKPIVKTEDLEKELLDAEKSREAEGS
jgi:hypothetical protein